jgi:predicted transcriptional regulator
MIGRKKEECDARGNGPCRLLKIYLRASIDVTIKFYEEEKSQEASQAMEAVQKLKELSSV